MRFRLDVAAADPAIPWSDVYGAARGVLYKLLKEQDPGLAAELHDRGWRGSSLRPVGVSPPQFRGAARRPGEYAASDDGWVWFGSPVPEIATALLAALPGRPELQWGRVALAVRGVELEQLPDFSSGEAVLESASSVLLKHESRYLLPDDPPYLLALLQNTRHKADVLGLPPEVEAEVLGAGRRRRHEAPGGARFGATVRVRVAAAPPLLDALYSWGLGLSTNQGFGWLR